MALNDYVSVSISATGPGPSAPGFGTGLALAYHTVGGSRVVMGPYTSTAGLAADFSNTSIGGSASYANKPPYLMAEKYFAQSPQPQLLYVGRRGNVFTQSVTLTPESAVTGTVYTFNIGATNGTGGSTVSYTVPSSSSISSVCTALALLFNSGGYTTTTWAASTAYTTASRVQPTVVNGYVYIPSVAGTSGASQPTWPTTIGATVTDGTVTWTCSAAIPAELYGFTATATGTTVTCVTNTAGSLVEWQVQVPATICYVSESTTDPGIATDLTAVWAASKAWYGLGVDSASKAETAAAAAWVESNGNVIFAASTSDSAAGDSTQTTDVLSTLKSNSYTRTAGLFTQYSNMSYGGWGWLATRLTQTPGSDTWNFNTIASVQADTDVLCPESVVLAVQAKNGSVYTTLAGLNLTQGGTSGGGEWMDQTRFIDWLRVNIQLAMIALLARNQGKVPYTDSGIAQVEQALRAVLTQGVTNGGLVAGSITITPPAVSSIPVASVQARTLPSLPWAAQLAGAIHRMSIQGVTSVA